MNASDYRKIARQKKQEAKRLLDSGFYSGSYYLAGISVECALKAIIAEQLIAKAQVPEKKFLNEFYNHDILGLVKLAEMELALNRERKASLQFAANWATINAWSVNKRYEHTTTRRVALDFYNALVARNDGFLAWLRS